MTAEDLLALNGKPCPCGSGRTFETCCEPLFNGERRAATAEELMRSRYTAHATQNYAYLHRTYQPTSALPYVEESNPAPIKWTKLVVHSHEAEVKPDLSYVEFSAFFEENGEEQVMQEKSEFRRVAGNWLFVRSLRNGPAPVKSVAPKVGRNDPCPCGSGKKYKHCCLK